jgi:hypothetical protein
MLIRFMRAVVVCAMIIVLAGCIFSRGPIFDVGKGVNRFSDGSIRGEGRR